MSSAYKALRGTESYITGELIDTGDSTDVVISVNNSFESTAVDHTIVLSANSADDGGIAHRHY